MGSEAARPTPTPLADGDADDSTFGVPAQHGLGSPRGLALMTIAAAGQPGGPSAQLLAACGSAAAPALAQELSARASRETAPLPEESLGQLVLACEPGGAAVVCRAFRASERLGLTPGGRAHSSTLLRVLRLLGRLGAARMAAELYVECVLRADQASRGCRRTQAKLLTALCLGGVQAGEGGAASAVAAAAAEARQPLQRARPCGVCSRSCCSPPVRWQAVQGGGGGAALRLDPLALGELWGEAEGGGRGRGEGAALGLHAARVSISLSLSLSLSLSH